MNIKSFSPRSLFLFAALLLLSNSAISQQRRLINYTEISALIHGSTSLTGNPTFNGFRTRTGVTKLLNENFGIGFALGLITIVNRVEAITILCLSHSMQHITSTLNSADSN